MVVVIDKDSDSIKVVTDGVARVVTIRKEDTVISIPPVGYRKIYNIYFDPDTEGLEIDVGDIEE